MISGKEAMIALANGEDVEVKFNYAEDWHLINRTDAYAFSIFLDERGSKFRLKPRTVNLNGVEVPSVKYVAHSGGNCVKISCECPGDAAAISAALRSIFNPQ